MLPKNELRIRSTGPHEVTRSARCGRPRAVVRSRPRSPRLDDAQPCGVAIMIAMRPTHNWIWALGVLLVWVAIFLAFLLIAIARP